MNLIPCYKFENNSLGMEFMKVMSEFSEVTEAFIKYNDKPNIDNKKALGLEAVDLQTAIETMLHIAGFDGQARDELRRQVYEKNLERGYYEIRKVMATGDNVGVR